MGLDISVQKTQYPKARPPGPIFGFGRYFSDHMFVADYAEPEGWNSLRIIPYQPVQLDPGAAVLHYGQAIFEGMKVYLGVDGKLRLFRPDMNWKRMLASADRLCMKMPDLELFIASLMSLVRADVNWVPASPGTALYLRPTLIGSEAFLGVRPSHRFMFYVIASPVSGYYGEGLETVKIWVERRYSRAAPGGIGAAKAGGNYASSLLAATEAKKNGYAQVLWLDACTKKYVEEVGTMNVFFRIGDRVITPPLGGTILPGVTRNSVLELLRDEGIAVEERPIALDEVISAHEKGDLKEVFGTGTAASISPVGVLGLEERILTINEERTGDISQKLHQLLTDIQYGRVADRRGWMVEVATIR